MRLFLPFFSFFFFSLQRPDVNAGVSFFFIKTWLIYFKGSCKKSTNLNNFYHPRLTLFWCVIATKIDRSHFLRGYMAQAYALTHIIFVRFEVNIEERLLRNLILKCAVIWYSKKWDYNIIFFTRNKSNFNWKSYKQFSLLKNKIALLFTQ